MRHKDIPKPVTFDYNKLMIWLRKGFVHFLAVLLLVCLLGGVTAIAFNHDLAHPAKLEGWLASSGVYDNLVPAELSQAQKSSDTNGGDSTVSYNDPAVIQAAEAAFSTGLAQSSANTFLDSNYDWLAGKTATPNFNIDLTSAKQNFAKSVGQSVETRLAGLPVCTPAQLAKISIPVNSLSVICRPDGLIPKDEGARITQQISSSNDFLGNPAITASSLDQALNKSQGQPYYQKLSWAPAAYRIGLKLPWILGGLAVLSSLGIVFIAPSRRRGARRIGAVLLLAGVILIAEKLVADALVKRLEKTTLHAGLASQLKQPISNLIGLAEAQLAKLDLWFGILFVVAALPVFAVLFKTRNRTNKPKTAKTSPAERPSAAPESPQADTGDIQLAPRDRKSAKDITDLRTRLSKPAQPSAPPLGKNPRPPKRPRLIQ